jgi:hypothetical protein
MSGKSPRRPAPAGHTKTDLRRGHLTPTRLAPEAASAVRPPAATSNLEQAFLFEEMEGSSEPLDQPAKR